ncbi:hypothetical protein S7711_11047 [Stachybotrys chartarum IBT 7711]|uniref:Aquaporin n=1 Tax=Stachybotrys chartarum (strain CBS 109288 / IBT 7711) TaxID=1280523 RepID=A0A084BBB0_STACB|nr:hypothetical protein S7711_11047 [Stachybotrys chartarum IBT 7711]KFA45647.1 hypothetical protein S40293_08922 [Stachybotrys chartarum IBT 40293]
MALRNETHPPLHPHERRPEPLADGSSGEKNPRPANIAVFDGSFAPSARPTVSADKPWYNDRDYFVKGWTSRQIWKAAFVESVGTFGVVYISGQISATLMNYGTVQIGAYIAISTIVLLSVFIYATAAGTGGHMNPMITFSAVLSGFCPLPRGVLYLGGQVAGSAVAGGLLMATWGGERAIRYRGGGCFYDPSQLSSGQAFLNEIVCSFILLYLAYGVGLDPRQAMLFGPKTGPLLVGASVGLIAFANSGAVPGYAGAQMHPGRCFAFGIARQDMDGQWIWWFGPAIAAVLLAIMYNLIPPHFASKGNQEL